MSETILEAKNLKKEFLLPQERKIHAVKGVDFEVKRGEIFGFLGPNGAGKSTTINMLTTQLRPTSGEIIIDGQSLTKDPASARRKIGVVTQHNNLDRGLTARENLVFHAKYFGIADDTANKRADVYFEKFGLKERQDESVRSYSGGMAQRLKIARAIMHHPDLLFLDEPTSGLDPNYRSILWEQMLSLIDQGTTIFLTTHYMEEPEKLCDRIAIVSEGKIEAIGTVEELRELIPAANIISIKLGEVRPEFVEQVKKLPEVENAVTQEDELLLYMNQDHPDFNGILEWVKTLGTPLKNINFSTSTLDDVFIHLTEKRSIDNDEKN